MLLGCMFGWFAQTEAQVPCFSYDAAGNRTARNSCASLAAPGTDEANEAAINVLGADGAPASAAAAVQDATELLDIRAVPNPGTGIFQVSGNAKPDAEVRILDLNGRVVVQRLLGEGLFDLSTQPDGAYLLWVQQAGESKMLLVRKITKP